MIPKVIQNICKDNTSILDVPEVIRDLHKRIETLENKQKEL